MTRMEKCKALRAETAIHYNCCQAVLVPFAAEMGVTEEQAYKMGAHFGSGMRHGGTCGVLTGALMVLGMAGKGEGKTAADLMAQMRREHGALECAELLKTSKEQGIEKKAHCDGLVYEMVQAVEEILK